MPKWAKFLIGLIAIVILIVVGFLIYINTAFIKKICQKICQPPLPSLPLIKTFELGLKGCVGIFRREKSI